MEENDCDSWEKASDNEDSYVDEIDEEDYYMSGFISKLQFRYNIVHFGHSSRRFRKILFDYLWGIVFRKDISKAHWNNELGMAEVVEKKGKMWTTTGIVRNGKTYCSIEETLFLAEIGALYLLDNNDLCLPLKEIYEKIANEKSGCSWELFEVYRHLKSLGYIVGRHGVPWIVKIPKGRDINITSDPVSLQVTPKRHGVMDVEPKEESSLVALFDNIQINEVRPVFDVYLPNRKFKKSCPGDPSFLLYLTCKVCPPSNAEIEVLERQGGSIPLKFCHVEQGRVSFFSFASVELPILP